MQLLDRGTKVRLATDRAGAKGTVTGHTEDERAIVAWEIGRTWIYPEDWLELAEEPLAARCLDQRRNVLEVGLHAAS